MQKKFLNVEAIYIIIIALAITIPAVLYFIFLNEPIIESHAYRQTQTAIVVFWMLQDGFNVIDYLMPVLGYPWSAPLEFPLYQYIVAKFSQLTNNNLEVVGRFISLIFFYLTLIPIVLVLKKYGKMAIIIGFVLYLTSPIELIYSRAFLIENIALFFSVSTFAIYLKIKRLQFIDYNYYSLLGFLLIFGSIAGLQKITTFLPVLLICFIDNLSRIDFKFKLSKNNFKLIIINILLVISILPAIIYSKFSDSIKKTGVISEYLLSNNQNSWIFGDITLRFSLEYWLKIFGYRLILLGGFSIAILWAIYLILNKKNKFNREATLSLLIGIAGPIIFGPLFFVHDYYLISSISFILIGFSVYISYNLFINYKNVLIIFIILVFNYTIFGFKYLPKLYNYSYLDLNSISVGKFLKDNLRKGQVSLIIGMDWSSVIPYYSEHYAIMIPSWLPNKSNVIKNEDNYSGDFSIGAYVICRNDVWPLDSSYYELISLMNNKKTSSTKIGSCDVFLKN